MFTKREKYDKLMVTDDEIQRRIRTLRSFVICSAWRECPEATKAVQTLLNATSEQLLAQELLQVVKRYIREAEK